jgi:hypothetical protein
MLSYLFDLAFVLIVGLTALFIARGMMMVEAALTFLAVVISSLVAITVFEPIAAWCVRHLFVSTDVYVTKYLWAAFAIFIFLLVFGKKSVRYLFCKAPEGPLRGKRYRTLFSENPRQDARSLAIPPKPAHHPRLR